MEWFPEIPEQPCKKCLVSPSCKFKGRKFAWVDCQKIDDYMHIDPYYIKWLKQRRILIPVNILLVIMIIFVITNSLWLKWF